MNDSAGPLQGAVLSHGRYSVLAKLGEGGMGYVFRAHDRNLDTDVVVKMPRRAMLEDPDFAGRFAREVRALVELAHPHIVKVSDVGEHDGLPFAVMQYLPGGSLEDRHALGGEGSPRPAEPAELSRWLPAVAAALDYAHHQGYVHRDVKPANILFDSQGNAFLGDFGVAKLIAAAAEAGTRRVVTGTGMVLGTPGYMAPEVILGTAPDGRADQYALGVVAFEVLSGRRPFEAATATAVLVQQTTVDAPSLDVVRPGLPAPLVAVIARALHRDPAARFADCASFARAAVEAAAAAPAHESSPAYSPSPAPASATVAVAAVGRKRLDCPVCAKPLGAPPNAAGRRIRCPVCSAKLLVAVDLGSLTLVDSEESGGTMQVSSLQSYALASAPGDREGNGPAQTERLAVRAPAPEPLPGRAGAAPSHSLDDHDQSPARLGLGAIIGVAAGAVLLVGVLAGAYVWSHSGDGKAPQAASKPAEAPPPAPKIAPIAPVALSPPPSGGGERSPAPERRRLEPVQVALDAGRLDEAKRLLTAYLADPAAPQREQAMALDAELDLVQSDARAKELLAVLAPHELDSFIVGGPWPRRMSHLSNALETAHLATLRRVAMEMRGPQQPSPPLAAGFAAGGRPGGGPGIRGGRGGPGSPGGRGGPGIPGGRGGAGFAAGRPGAAAPPTVAAAGAPTGAVPADINEVMTDPERFGDRLVIPRGFFWIGTKASRISGQIALPVKDSDGNTLADGVSLGSSRLLFLIAEPVARQLNDWLAQNQVAASAKTTCKSVLALQIRRESLAQGPRWVAMIVAMQILQGVNYANIIADRLTETFRVVWVTSDFAQLGYGEGPDWAERLGGEKYTGLVKRRYREAIRSAKAAQNRAQLDSAMVRMMGETMKLKQQRDAAQMKTYANFMKSFR
jgi:serine/threonine-protein kinase